MLIDSYSFLGKYDSEYEDFNSDIDETHSKPFEIAIQYIELKPEVEKKL